MEGGSYNRAAIQLPRQLPPHASVLAPCRRGGMLEPAAMHRRHALPRQCSLWMGVRRPLQSSCVCMRLRALPPAVHAETAPEPRAPILSPLLQQAGCVTPCWHLAPAPGPSLAPADATPAAAHRHRASCPTHRLVDCSLSAPPPACRVAPGNDCDNELHPQTTCEKCENANRDRTPHRIKSQWCACTAVGGHETGLCGRRSRTGV